ncbi:hypothetical protein ATANTOWER_024662 [Ataeniobius toweri]|uniref:Uncharacterized protein n=1 Tax=Ataeniobius toweri TaxID=208326 RepID=A0ABU7BUZ2_9TELE|nr:hypothetical protein [Ataeniobius toweri]
MKSRRVGPPDGGYGWVVVASAFFVMGLTGAVLKNFSHFFLEIQSHFGVMTSTTSWVSSTTIAMFHIGAPAASALTLQFSQRAVIIVGGLLCTLGMLLASLDLSLPWLYLTMGVLEGWLVDQTNDYSAAFYLSGFCLITSAVFVVLVDFLLQRRKSAKLSGHQTINQRGDGETGKVKGHTVTQEF